MSTLLVRALIVATIVTALVLVARAQRRRRQAWAPKTPILALESLPYRSSAPLHLVSFTSPLCGDCQEVPRIALAAAPEVPLITLDVREHATVVQRLGIQTVPTLVLVDEEGRIRWTHVGLPDATEMWLYVREAWDSTRTVQSVVAAKHKPQS